MVVSVKSPKPPPPKPKGGPTAEWVAEHGDYLFRFALSRVGQRGDAEDLVQETFLAAHRSHSSFRGLSTPRTYLTGILKHKILDFLRRKYRLAKHIDTSAGDGLFESQFDESGSWRMGTWLNDPVRHLGRLEISEAIFACLAQLPDRQRALFTQRVLEDRATPHICREFGIEENNLGVLLFRCRLLLQKCLEKKHITPAGVVA